MACWPQAASDIQGAMFMPGLSPYVCTTVLTGNKSAGTIAVNVAPWYIDEGHSRVLMKSGKQLPAKCISMALALISWVPMFSGTRHEQFKRIGSTVRYAESLQSVCTPHASCSGGVRSG